MVAKVSKNRGLAATPSNACNAARKRGLGGHASSMNVGLVVMVVDVMQSTLDAGNSHQPSG